MFKDLGRKKPPRRGGFGQDGAIRLFQGIDMMRKSAWMSVSTSNFSVMISVPWPILALWVRVGHREN